MRPTSHWLDRVSEVQCAPAGGHRTSLNLEQFFRWSTDWQRVLGLNSSTLAGDFVPGVSISHSSWQSFLSAARDPSWCVHLDHKVIQKLTSHSQTKFGLSPHSYLPTDFSCLLSIKKHLLGTCSDVFVAIPDAGCTKRTWKPPSWSLHLSG